jgi:hypothetical protein
MRVLLGSIVALQLVAGAAHGDAAEDAAQVHLERGITAFRAGNFTNAHHELAAASELAPHKPNPYRWLALTDVQLGDCARALVDIESFLARVPAEDARIAELVRLRELCQRTGVLQVTSTPVQASLRIDGAVVGATPYKSLSMRAGSHVLVAEKPGFAATTRSIIVPAGSALEVRLELTARSTPVTRRWWFWPAVAGTALTVAGVALYVAHDTTPTLLPPVQCDETGCRPGGA